MKITKDQLKGWNACKDGYAWFLRGFPEGEAEPDTLVSGSWVEAAAEAEKEAA